MGLKGLIAKTPLPSSETSVLEGCNMMGGAGLGALPVVDEGRLVGIFTYRDLIQRVVTTKRDPERVGLRELMTPYPVTLRATDGFGDAPRLMVERDYTYLPVLESDGRLLGLLSLRVLLEHQIDHLASELDSVPRDVAADGAGGD